MKIIFYLKDNSKGITPEWLNNFSDKCDVLYSLHDDEYEVYHISSKDDMELLKDNYHDDELNSNKWYMEIV